MSARCAIVREDGQLRVLNLLVLLCVAFLPFPTKVVGEHGSTTVAAVFYAASMATTGLAFAVLWSRLRGSPAGAPGR